MPGRTAKQQYAGTLGTAKQRIDQQQEQVINGPAVSVIDR